MEMVRDAGVIMLILILLSGFSLVRTLVPGWWIWVGAALCITQTLVRQHELKPPALAPPSLQLYWANPMAWTFRSVVTNEFTAGRWDVPASNSTLDGPSIGETVLSNFGMWSDYTWVWNAAIYNLGIYALLVAFSCWAFGASKAPVKEATAAAAKAEGGSDANALEAVEAQPASGGGGGATLDIAFRCVCVCCSANVPACDMETDLSDGGPGCVPAAPSPSPSKASRTLWRSPPGARRPSHPRTLAWSSSCT